MPVWNGERFLAQAIESVLSQTHNDFQLVICDDGSTDRTPEIISSYDDPRIIHTWQNHAGIVPAFNRAYSLATGDAIALLAHDDVIPPNSLEVRAKRLSSGFKAVYINGWYCDANLDPIFQVHPRGRDLTWEKDYRLVCRRCPISGGFITIMRNISSKIFPIPESLALEDWWIVFHTLFFARRIAFIPEPLFFYRIHGANDCTTSISGPSFDIMRIKDWSRHPLFYDKLIAEIPGLGLSADERWLITDLLEKNRNITVATLQGRFSFPSPAYIRAVGVEKYVLSQALILKKAYILQNLRTWWMRRTAGKTKCQP